MVKPTRPKRDEHSKLTAASRYFSDLITSPDISEEQIDSAIEELRPIRMWFHADKYGDAPGFRLGLVNLPNAEE